MNRCLCTQQRLIKQKRESARAPFVGCLLKRSLKYADDAGNEADHIREKIIMIAHDKIAIDTFSFFVHFHFLSQSTIFVVIFFFLHAMAVAPRTVDRHKQRT